MTILNAAWEQGMRHPDSPLLAKAALDTGLTPARIKSWISMKQQAPKLNQIRRKTGYQLFAASLKTADLSQFGPKWKALSKSDRAKWNRAAVEHNEVPVSEWSEREREERYKKLLKNIFKACGEIEQLGKTVGGFVVTGDKVSLFGGERGAKLLESMPGLHTHLQFHNYTTKPEVVAPTMDLQSLREQVRSIFNMKYTEALSLSKSLAPGKIKKVPYSKLGSFSVNGLPEGITVKDPSWYGGKMCRAVIGVQDDIKFTLQSATTENETGSVPTV